MSLFGPISEGFKENAPRSIKKRQFFREELRKSQKDRQFSAVRKQLIQSLKSLKFLEEIKSDLNNLTLQQLPQLLGCFQSGLNNAVFYQHVVNMNIEHYLCQFIKQNAHKLSISEKNKIMRSLVELTYYCWEGFKAIIEDQLIDWIKKQIQIIRENDKVQKPADIQEQQCQFIFLSVTLSMNLAASGDKQFNYYLMETDFIQTVLYYLDKKSRNSSLSDQSIYNLRSALLTLFANLFNKKVYIIEFIMKTLDQVLTDQYYLVANSDQVIKCLLRATEIPDFWKVFISHKKYSDFLRNLQKHINRIIETEDNDGMSYLGSLLVTIFENEQQLQSYSSGPEIIKVCIQEGQIIKLMDRIMQNPTHKNIETVGKWIKVVYYFLLDEQTNLFPPKSDNFQDQYSIAPTKMDFDQLIKILLFQKNLFHIRYGKYSIALISLILQNNSAVLDVMIDHGIIDQLPELLFWNQYHAEAKIQAIDLVKNLILTEEKFKGNKNDCNRMLQALQGKGIIKQVEKLQDVQLRGVYKKAEEFMDWLTDFKLKN